MKVCIVFEDWKKGNESVYKSEAGINLSMGALHSGSMWEGEINFDPDTEAEIRGRGAYRVIFEVLPSEEVKRSKL